MYIFDLELYSFLIIIILVIDYFFKYRKSFEIDSYLGLAYILSIVIFLLVNIGIYTISPFSAFGKFVIYFAYVYSFIPPSILYIYTKRNYSSSVINTKKETKKMLLYNFVCLSIIIIYLNLNFNSILITVNHNFSFFPYDHILSLGLLPLLFLSIKIIINAYFKTEEVIYKLFSVTFLVSLFVILNFYTSFIMLGTVVYTICALLICLNKYDKSIYRDSLTGLYNRRKLQQYIVSKVNTHRLRAIYVIDMDKFKYINDKYGHTKGDTILRNVASLIKRSISSEDFAVRYGGDEFIVIAELENEKKIEVIQNKIKRNIKNYNSKVDIPISLSIGSSIWRDDETFEEIMEKSDSKMYKNKYDKLLTEDYKND